jgi:hypothetical protein
MSYIDANGKAYKRLSEVKEGDEVTFDGGFTCLEEGDVQPVYKDDKGFYVLCKQGQHYLDGQLDHVHKTDALIGIYSAA